MTERAEGAVTPATIEELCVIADLRLPAWRRELLAGVVATLREGARALDSLDLTDVEPEIVFDARWEKSS